MFANQRRESVDIHGILGTLLVGTAEHELQLVLVHANSLENCGDDLPVVFRAVFYQFQWRLQIIKDCDFL